MDKMSKDLLNILTNSNKDIDNQKLMDYISGKLSGKEKHEIEKLIVDSQFLNDAVEGLGNIHDKHKLKEYIEQLNKGLQNHLQKKKMRREKRRIKEYPWIYFTIGLILLLCVIGYFVIRQYLR
jgi:hypothetical protein